MEIILLAIGGIIWLVIKALSAVPPAPPPPRQRIHQQSTSSPAPERIVTAPVQETGQGGSFFADDTETLEESDSDSHDGLVTADSLLKGIIMAEVLNPPRSRRRHHIPR